MNTPRRTFLLTVAACGAAVATGEGEAISRVGLARTATDLLAAGSDATTAARSAIGCLSERVGGRGGLILLDRHGRPGAAYNTGRMPHGWVVEDGVVTNGDRCVTVKGSDIDHAFLMNDTGVLEAIQAAWIGESDFDDG